MIKINDIEVDCLISFTISTDNETWYEETAADGTLLTEHRNWRDNISFVLSPKTQYSFDLIISQIRNSGGSITVNYPIDTKNTVTRRFVVSNFSYSLEQYRLNNHRFGSINCTAKEVLPRA